MNRAFVSMGAGFAGFGVVLGAFGAHALRDRLSATDLEIWQTAVQYQMAHAFALILVGLAAAHISNRAIKVVGILFAIGILFFSGSLYALALTDVKLLGAITPIGGLCFIAGWAVFAISALRPESL